MKPIRKDTPREIFGAILLITGSCVLFAWAVAGMFWSVHP